VGRNKYLFLFLAVLVAAFALPLWSLFRFANNHDTFDYIPLIPVVSAYLIFQGRKEIFSGGTGNRQPGALLLLAGILLYVIGLLLGSAWNPLDRHAILAVSFVSCLAGGLGVSFGSGALKAAFFPLAFLLFMAPIPTAILDKIVAVLQAGSAEVSYAVLKLTGVPLLREGYVFHVPGLSVEVAKQCSGIRSSLSLFIVSLLAGHFFLKTGWRKAVLSIMVVPITIFKNGLRIVTLTLLSAYVDPSFMKGSLHTSGGIPFFLAAMTLLAGVLWILRRSEKKEAAGE